MKAELQHEVVHVARSMLKRHSLCDYCLGRLFARRLRRTSDGLLGGRIRRLAGTTAGRDDAAGGGRKPAGAARCHICRGLFDRLGSLLEIIDNASEGYEFESFVLGTTLRPSVIDRDDCVRSTYRLRGADGIKTGLAREMTRRFSRRSGSRQDRLEPEITLTLQPALDSCTVRSKPVAVFGRYTKTARGMPQRQESCRNCAGAQYAASCRAHDASSGPRSVEGAISQILLKWTGGTAARFTWIGGEDRDSLVLGSGRPFFARIQNPRRRVIRRDCHLLGPIRLSGLRTVSTTAVRHVPFSSLVRIRVAADMPGSDPDTQGDQAALSATLKRLRHIPKSITVLNRDGRRAQKTIESVTYRRNTANTFTITIRADGGIPIKRLVNGEGVTPSVSQVLGIPCRCEQFDFFDVSVRGRATVQT